VTRLLSRQNLYKSNCFVLQDEDKRMIDTNQLVENKIKHLQEAFREIDVEKITQGLDSDQVAMLLEDEGEALAVQSGPSYEELVEAANLEIETMWNKFHEDIKVERDAAYQSGFAQGKRDGYNTGYQEGFDKTKQIEKELRDDVNKQLQLLNKEREEMEPKLVNIITSIYEHFFKVDFKTQKGLVMHLIRKALKEVDSSRDYIVHISKEDYPLVSLQKQSLLEGINLGSSTVEFVEDHTLARNECLIETDGGIFDCSLGVQFEELAKELRLLSFQGKEDVQ